MRFRSHKLRTPRGGSKRKTANEKQPQYREKGKVRSEERMVGKEDRSRWAPKEETKKKTRKEKQQKQIVTK